LVGVGPIGIMQLYPLLLFPAGRVTNPHMITAQREQRPPVRGDSQAASVSALLDLQERIARRRVPEMDGPIPTVTSEQVPAVGREGSVPRPPRVTQRLGLALARGNIPQVKCRGVPFYRGQRLAVAREGDLRSWTLAAVHLLASCYIPKSNS